MDAAYFKPTWTVLQQNLQWHRHRANVLEAPEKVLVTLVWRRVYFETLPTHPYFIKPDGRYVLYKHPVEGAILAS